MQKQVEGVVLVRKALRPIALSFPSAKAIKRKRGWGVKKKTKAAKSGHNCRRKRELKGTC